MILRVLLVDSSPQSLERLARQILAQAHFEIVGRCMHRAAAVSALRDLEPDVVFLEAAMPDGDGFSALEELPPDSRPALVAMGSSGAHAVRAFEAGAIDYVIKPVAANRLAATLERVRRQTRVAAGPSAGSAHPPLKRVLVRETDRMVVVPIERIDWMESANNYIVLHAGRETHVLRETMTTIEQKLPPQQFLRVSRFAIVNLDRVRELRAATSGSHLAVMTDGIEVPLTRGIREVQEHLQFA